MSSDNQVLNADPTVNVHESADTTDNVYRVAVLLIIALVYMGYISPMLNARAVTAKSAGTKVTIRWADLIIKMAIVFHLLF